MTAESPERDGVVVAERPAPGTPRPYDFPTVTRSQLDNGLTVLVADLPGRPLVSATIVVPVGAADEPAGDAGAAVLAARALTEGTERYDAVGLTEAAERLGASLHAEAGWDATSVGVDVPTTRLEPALELLAEVLLRPTFPADEVERLGTSGSTICCRRRPIRDDGRTRRSSARSTRRRRRTTGHPAGPARRSSVSTIDVVAPGVRADPRPGPGDAGRRRRPGRPGRRCDRRATVRRLVAARRRRRRRRPSMDQAAGTGRLVRVVHRPGSVQTEIRIGHPGLPRRVPDYHAVSVMSAILGGLFNSRLNMQLREAKGYTYGAGAGFDMRRGAGPFTARAAVNTEVTVPAVLDTLAELERMRDTRVEATELAAARDFLVGVFPLRFETPGAVVGALAGLAVHEPAARGADRLSRADRGGRYRCGRCGGPGAPRRSTAPPSCWSATSTRSGRSSRRPGWAGS